MSKLLHCSRNSTELGCLISPEDESVLVIFPRQRVELYEGAERITHFKGYQVGAD